MKLWIKNEFRKNPKNDFGQKSGERKVVDPSIA